MSGVYGFRRVDLLQRLTMAHNQDRLQNSDSSVVYGHGHIIYDSDSGDVGDTPLRQAIKQPTMSLNGPPQKHISVYLLKECALLHTQLQQRHTYGRRSALLENSSILLFFFSRFGSSHSHYCLSLSLCQCNLPAKLDSPTGC